MTNPELISNGQLIYGLLQTIGFLTVALWLLNDSRRRGKKTKRAALLRRLEAR